MTNEFLQRRIDAAKFERKRLKRLIKEMKLTLKTNETSKSTDHSVPLVSRR